MEADSWIQKLPDEVLIYILTLISPYQDLHSAAQVCRQWRHCVHQVVYQRKSNFTKAVNQMKLLWTKSECNNDTKKPLISRRYSHSAVYDETHNCPSVFIFGGCTSTSTTFNDLWRLDPTKREWSRPLATGAYPSPKACATLVKSRPGELMLFGGWTHPSPYPLHQSWRLFNELHTYDIATMRWNLITPASELKPPTMAGHSASIHNGHMIIFGGLQKRSTIGQFSSSNDVWSFNTDSHTWTQMDIPEPRPKPRYGQSQLYLDENHILMLGGCGGPTQVYHDVWLLVMKYPHWKWVECDIKNPENRAENLWLHPACKVGDYAIILGKNIQPKNNKQDAAELSSTRNERWNFIPQARRGLNRGYGAIRRPHQQQQHHQHHPSASQDLQPQRNSPYAPRNSPSRLRMMRSSWLQDDDDTESSSTADDMEEDDDDEEVKLAVEPVVESGGASGSSESSSANKVFRSSVTLNVNEDEPMPSTSSRRGASALPSIRIPPPRMQAFAVPSTSLDLSRPTTDDPTIPFAKRKQIETRQRQLDSLKKIEDRYKNLQKEEFKSKEPKLSNSTSSNNDKFSIPEKMKPPHQCIFHENINPEKLLSMFVLDISKAISNHEVEWLQFCSNGSFESPEVSILYSLVEGRGELIMFGGIRKNADRGGENSDHDENDSVSNALYFLNPPCKVV